jgi:hypothetical protein
MALSESGASAVNKLACAWFLNEKWLKHVLSSEPSRGTELSHTVAPPPYLSTCLQPLPAVLIAQFRELNVRKNTTNYQLGQVAKQLITTIPCREK